MNVPISFALASALVLSAVVSQPKPDANAPAAQPGVPSGHPQIPMPKVAENWPKAKPEDVKSVEAIMASFYAVPAGAPGEARDWDRFRSLFVPDARMIPARPGAEGTAGAYFLPVADYIDANKVYFEKGGFNDREIFRRVEEFGNIVHVWSTYESRRKPDAPEPYIRGINSIQLLKDGDRYWIINVYWDFERPDTAIPAKYLPKPKE